MIATAASVLFAIVVVGTCTVRRMAKSSAPAITDEEMQAYDRAVMDSHTWSDVP